MAKNQNTAEKRRREVEKKFKAEEKRKNREKKKLAGPELALPSYPADDLDDDDDKPADAE
jgi:hypothetical protein